jgi:hypothetical protein
MEMDIKIILVKHIVEKYFMAILGNLTIVSTFFHLPYGVEVMKPDKKRKGFHPSSFYLTYSSK